MTAKRDPARLIAGKLTARLRERNTFANVAAEVIVQLRREGKARATIRKRLWLLRTLAKDLRARPIAHITAPEILAVLRKAESRGRLESARRLRAAIGQVMRLAVATDRAPLDPTPALRGLIAAPRVKHRAAVTTPEGVGKLMTAISGYDGKIIRPPPRDPGNDGLINTWANGDPDLWALAGELHRFHRWERPKSARRRRYRARARAIIEGRARWPKELLRWKRHIEHCFFDEPEQRVICSFGVESDGACLLRKAGGKIAGNGVAVTW